MRAGKYENAIPFAASSEQAKVPNPHLRFQVTARGSQLASQSIPPMLQWPPPVPPTPRVLPQSHLQLSVPELSSSPFFFSFSTLARLTSKGPTEQLHHLHSSDLT